MTTLATAAFASMPATSHGPQWLRASLGFAGSTALLILGMLTLGHLAA
ncbi:hypothetical protein [Methylobacterium frigidaeris]|uniref:Uncharacterized protein n=1 Tax=Methylobacterium frigidaeris TaxID=2038277 RepID=A0AA37HIR5_9HYPH|nr:hypothetical protein [Methylobacterium frigidaeris]GJD65910.1 hypothetical protein MPEAHAMD_6106 [Methylobacterium frigidaeris]